MNSLLCVAATAAFLVASNLAMECSNNRCTARGLTNIMCKYPDRKPSPDCGIVYSIGFTAAEKTEIINMHNELRQFVAAGREMRGKPGPQPVASNMKTVVWDNELAELAQRWANQCGLRNDDCRDVARFAVGQNIDYKRTRMVPRTTPSDVLMTWYNEVQNMDRYHVKYLITLDMVSNYTQMVWGHTRYVGCGKIAFIADTWDTYYMVCNYGPAGNYLGEPVYLAFY